MMEKNWKCLGQGKEKSHGAFMVFFSSLQIQLLGSQIPTVFPNPPPAPAKTLI